jgi:hypothetical protein
MVGRRDALLSVSRVLGLHPVQGTFPVDLLQPKKGVVLRHQGHALARVVQGSSGLRLGVDDERREAGQGEAKNDWVLHEKSCFAEFGSPACGEREIITCAGRKPWARRAADNRRGT